MSFLDKQAAKIIEAVRSARCDLSNEKATQADIAAALTAANIAFKREMHLSRHDIPDFFIDGIALEVKVKGARRASILAQLERYAKQPEVLGLILVSNVSMGLPPAINKRPVWFVSLGMAWL